MSKRWSLLNTPSSSKCLGEKCGSNGLQPPPISVKILNGMLIIQFTVGRGDPPSAELIRERLYCGLWDLACTQHIGTISIKGKK